MEPRDVQEVREVVYRRSDMPVYPPRPAEPEVVYRRSDEAAAASTTPVTAPPAHATPSAPLPDDLLPDWVLLPPGGRVRDGSLGEEG